MLFIAFIGVILIRLIIDNLILDELFFSLWDFSSIGLINMIC